MRNVADGQQVEIPVLRVPRTVGTHVEGAGRERRDRRKRKRGRAGKTARQPEAVTRSERKVAKRADHVPRKAAMAARAPVP